MNKKITIGFLVGIVGLSALLFFVFGGFSGQAALADDDDDDDKGKGRACRDLPSHSELEAALIVARNTANGGFSLDMWGTIVNRGGEVCAVAFTGANRGDQWPGSRVISAQKANTANSFSLPILALSTANLFTAVQPGGSLFGLQESNPVDTKVAYRGKASKYGQPKDPMVGGKIGGVNVFGGGLALYNSDGELVGAIGVSGDSSCADHNIAWKTRHGLNFDNVPLGVNDLPPLSLPNNSRDNIVNDTVVDADTGHTTSPSGWGHTSCSVASTGIAAGLPVNFPVGPNP